MPLLKKKGFTIPPPPPLPPTPAAPKNNGGVTKDTTTDTGQVTNSGPPPLLPLPTSFPPLKTTSNGTMKENVGVANNTSFTHNGVALKATVNHTSGNDSDELQKDQNSGTIQNTGEQEDGKSVEEKSDKKPKPPAKPSRLMRAFTSGSLTLQRFNNKSNKKKDTNKRQSMTLEDEVVSETVNGRSELRDSGLWKLPGLEASDTKAQPSPRPVGDKRNSLKPTKVSTSSLEEGSRLQKSGESTPPMKSTPRQSKTSQDLESEIRNRELPPLPTGEDPDDNYASIHPEPTQGNELNASPLMPDHIDNSPQETETAHDSDSKLNDSMSSSKDGDKTPPPLPVRTYAQPQQDSRRMSQVTSSVTTLKEVLDQYVGCYPLRFRVLQGYCSDNSEINMSTDDVYDIHLVKETKVVTVKADNGMIHRVPLGSSQKVGIIYNPTQDYEKGLQGHTFRNVADITSTQELPKVICSTSEAKSSDGKQLLEENEILVVRQIHRTLFKGKRGLKVLSIGTMTEKLLPEECVGYFSTKPSLVRLHLPEIVECVPKVFPVRAVMYSAGDSGMTSDQPDDVTGVVTLTECSTETSLVVSAAPFDESLELIPMDQVDFANSELFDLPLDDDMRALEVAVVQVTPKPEPEPEQLETVESGSEENGEMDEASDSEESDHVYDDTVNVMRSQDFVVNNSMSHLNDSQMMLHSSAYSDIGKTDPSNVFEEEDGYDTVGLHLLKQTNNLPRSNQYNRGSYTTDPFDGNDPRITSWLEDLQTSTRDLEEKMATIEANKSTGTSEITEMKSMILQLTSKIESVETQLQTLTQQVNDSKENTSTNDEPDGEAAQPSDGRTQEEINKAYLKTLSTEEVCQLLDAMSLGQYKEHIEGEFVTGDILLEFDDEILKDDLGMKSKIQRIRLMKVVNGLYSAKELLKK